MKVNDVIFPHCSGTIIKAETQNNFIQRYKQVVEQIIAETDTLVSNINLQTNLTITNA